MELAESDLLFIDVDASTPAVKQEQEEVPGHESSPEIALSSIPSLKTEDSITPESKSTKKCYKVQNKVPSSAQLAYLVERMKKNPVIARGCLRSAPDRQRARMFWEHICLRLNKIPGTTKTSNQWMKFWTDKKKFVKKKAAHRSKLSDIEEKIYYLGGGITYRNIKRKTEPPKVEAETVNSNVSELDISDDEFSQNLKDNVQSLGLTSPTTDLNKTTSKKFSHHKKKKAPSENRFKCNTCDYITYHRALFQEHINRHEGIKPYKCELCPYSSVSKKYAKQHQDKHKTCPCGFLSRNAPELRRHMAKCGNRAPIEAVAQKCPSCKREYVDEKALAKHRLNRHICSLCPLQFCAIVTLKIHMFKAHNIADQSIKKHRFQCATCSWTSSLQQKILLHLIHHPQEVDSDIVDVEVLRRCGILPLK